MKRSRPPIRIKVRKVRVTLRHVHGHLLDLHEAVMQVLENQCQHSRTLENIVASNAQLQQDLTDLGTQVEKIQTEIVKRIADLEAAITAGGTPSPEVEAALAALKGKVDALDALTPDV